MPHDRYGRLVEVGDVVKGCGYNIKHEIIGEVLYVNPSATECNLQVAIVTVEHPPFYGAVYILNDPHGRQVSVRPGIEYGETRAFEIIQKADGSAPAPSKNVCVARRMAAAGAPLL